MVGPKTPLSSSLPSGHAFRREGARGPVWYAKYRLPDGRQRQRRVGPAWTSRGRPQAGYFTRTMAEDWLRDVLHEARRGTLSGMTKTGATFSDAAAEYLRWVEHDRQLKPSTLRDYRSIVRVHLLPAFGRLRLEDVSVEHVEPFSAALGDRNAMTNRTRLKVLTVLHGVMKRAQRVWKLPSNPVAGIEKPAQRVRVGINVFAPEEIHALLRAAASEQDAAIDMTAAFTGLRRGDEPRPGRPRTISDADLEAVIIKTLESKPKNATHWSTRSMAAETGLTQNAIVRIWHAFGLQPHRQETWKL